MVNTNKKIFWRDFLILCRNINIQKPSISTAIKSETVEIESEFFSIDHDTKAIPNV